MDADGGNLARWWGGGEANEFSPDWSPDGSRIAYWSCVSGPAPCRIHVVSGTAEGGVAWDLTDDVLVSGRLDWSPDGRYIAFVSEGDLFVMQADGQNVLRLTEGEGNIVWPDW